MKRLFVLLLLLLLLSPAPSSAADVIIGNDTLYSVVAGDSLQLISARLGADINTIIRENGLEVKKPLPVGLMLKVNTRKIVPRTAEKGIIVNIPAGMLYYFKNNRLETAFPVGLGMPKWRELTRWRTPVGTFTITGKEKNPTWYVPQSIQRQMRIQGKPVQTVVPPGPANPLGRYVLYTSLPGIAIHETIWPTTVYRFRSHGCIRLLPRNMEQFFEDVEVGASGELIYQPVTVAVTEAGRVFLEAHPDVYGKIDDLMSQAAWLIEERGLAEGVDWDKVGRVVRERSGAAEDVTAATEHSLRALRPERPSAAGPPAMNQETEPGNIPCFFRHSVLIFNHDGPAAPPAHQEPRPLRKKFRKTREYQEGGPTME